MIVTLFILIVLLLLSASFSSFETALFSLNPVQKRRIQEAGGIFSLIVKILERPRELLTTVLLGNELVNVGIAILAGGFAIHLFAGSDLRTVYLVSTAVITLVLLIFGEILPKNIAVRTPLVVSQVLLVPYQIFAWIFFPLRWVFTKMADGIVRLFGADPKMGRRLIVEEELRSLLELGKKEGTLAELERTLIHNALDFSSETVGRLMTPRERVVAVSVDTPFDQVLEVLKEQRFSRLPVYDKGLDLVVGVLHAKELLKPRLQAWEGDDPSLASLLKPYVEVDPAMTLDRVFEEFQRRRIHMGIVRDVQGHVAGLITMEDLLRRFFQKGA